jgi:hypothetical protein
MKQAGAVSVMILILFSLVLSGCGGGGGGGGESPPQTSVTIKGRVDDGTTASPISNAVCRFEQQDSTVRIPTNANPAGEFILLLDPDVEGFFRCNPRSLPSLTLSTFLSTVGRMVGDEIPDKNVTPATTVVAEALIPLPAADRRGREADLLADLKAQETHITLLVDVTTRLYQSLLTKQVNVDFADSESAEGDGGDGDGGDGDGGDGGGDAGAEGDAGDGAEGSPIANAACDFALKVEDTKPLVRSVLGDFDDGILNRPDLQTVKEQVLIEDSKALATAFSALFPQGISHPFTTVANDVGRYNLQIPPAVPGVVRCAPPDQKELRLATVIRELKPGELLAGQDVTPQTTYFSTTIDDPAIRDVTGAKEEFLNAIMGLVVVQENGGVTTFHIEAPEAVTDKDTGLAAFSATALFNSLLLKQTNVDYVGALGAFISGGTENPEQAVASLETFLKAESIPVEDFNSVSSSMDMSVDEAEQGLGTALEDALKVARLTVKVIDAMTGVGIAGAMVNAVDPLGVVQCGDDCPATTDDMGEAHLMLSNVPVSPTTITIEIIAGEFETKSVGANVAASDTVITEVPLGNEQFALTVTLAGEGSGTVQSEPLGITCGDDCTESFAPGIPVTLTATPDEGFSFDGWSGDGCRGMGRCTVTMDQNRTVIATFIPTPPPILPPALVTLMVQGSGNGLGTVTSNPGGISCSISAGTASGACSEPYDSGAEVILTAAPAAGSNFTGWSGGGCDDVTDLQCTVIMDQAGTVTAIFTIIEPNSPLVFNLEIESNISCTGPQGQPGRTIIFSFDYSDADGDMLPNGIIEREARFDSGAVVPNIISVTAEDGSGFFGTIRRVFCTAFSSRANSADITMFAVDGAGNRSASPVSYNVELNIVNNVNRIGITNTDVLMNGDAFKSPVD